MSDLLLDTCALLWLANGVEMTPEFAPCRRQSKTACVADQRVGNR